MTRSSGYVSSFEMAVPAAPDIACPSAGRAGPRVDRTCSSCVRW
jgi:hypothetical protein